MARGRRRPEEKPSRLAALAGLVVARPAASGGAALMAVTATAILVNALLLQPGNHPAPLFRDTRPVAGSDLASFETSGAGTIDTIDDLVARTTGRTPRARDEGLVLEIQAELKARGYYDGEVDGLSGPMTAAAIVRFEEDQGLTVTGEPTGDVLAALRAGEGARIDAAPRERSSAMSAGPAVAPRPAPVAIPAPRARPAILEADAAPDVETTETVAAAVDVPRPEPAALRGDLPQPDPRLAKVQETLDLLGYGPLSPDGRWTPETRAAIRRFEENRGLSVTGELTPAVLDELVRIGGFAGG
jgi:peptidoglycan hydrolase-like protein with peptidoglycan-binding domain